MLHSISDTKYPERVFYFLFYSSKITKDTLQEAIAAMLAFSKRKKRRFTESVDLQIALKNYDPQKDKRFSGTVKYGQQSFFFIRPIKETHRRQTIRQLNSDPFWFLRKIANLYICHMCGNICISQQNFICPQPCDPFKENKTLVVMSPPIGLLLGSWVSLNLTDLYPGS